MGKIILFYPNIKQLEMQLRKESKLIFFRKNKKDNHKNFLLLWTTESGEEREEMKLKYTFTLVQFFNINNINSFTSILQSSF